MFAYSIGSLSRAVSYSMTGDERHLIFLSFMSAPALKLGNLPLPFILRLFYNAVTTRHNSSSFIWQQPTLIFAPFSLCCDRVSSDCCYPNSEFPPPLIFSFQTIYTNLTLSTNADSMRRSIQNDGTRHFALISPSPLLSFSW